MQIFDSLELQSNLRIRKGKKPFFKKMQKLMMAYLRVFTQVLFKTTEKSYE